MLEVDRVVVTYGPFLALDGVDLIVESGEIVGIIGPNGAGKSSLVRAIAGLVSPAQGRITFRGVTFAGHPPEKRARMGLSLVPEGRGLFPQMSVDENLLMSGYALADRRRLTGRMERCYEIFPILRQRRRQLAGTLSGGQQQMLAIASGLMAEPQLLILDEPSLGLAPIIIGQIGDCLKGLKETGLTVLLTEQNATLTCNVADRIYVMQTGRIRYHDTPEKLFQDPEVVESFLTVN